MLVMKENWAEKLEGSSGVRNWFELGKKKQHCDV